MFKANLVKFCKHNLPTSEGIKVAAKADELECNRVFVYLVERWAESQHKKDIHEELSLWDAVNDPERCGYESHADYIQSEHYLYADDEQNAAVVVLEVLSEVYHLIED